MGPGMAQHELFNTDGLIVGEQYSRLEMARVGGVTSPTGPRDAHWSSGFVRFANVTVLLVTLEKGDGGYEDHFDGHRFLWQSQYRQSQKSKDLIAMMGGEVAALLFVRVFRKEKGVTQPFLYCGEVVPQSMSGNRPVDCVFSVKEDLHRRSNEMDLILEWRPLKPEDMLGAALFHARECAESEEKGEESEDRRDRALRAIYVRRGQRAFRRKLLRAYKKSCAVTGCKVESILEAAHISPYRGSHTNDVSNGLLLRADIHTLFDLGLLWIAEDFTVQVAKAARYAPYDQLHGCPIQLPKSAVDKPCLDKLRAHADAAKARMRHHQKAH